jgi:hypothetical protein
MYKYVELEQAWERRAKGRTFKRINGTTRLEKEGAVFLWVFTGSSEPLVLGKVYPDETMELFMHGQNNMTFQSRIATLSGINVHSDKSRHGNKEQWIRVRGQRQRDTRSWRVSLPFREGMRVRNGYILDEHLHVDKVKRLKEGLRKEVQPLMRPISKLMRVAAKMDLMGMPRDAVDMRAVDVNWSEPSMQDAINLFWTYTGISRWRYESYPESRHEYVKTSVPNVLRKISSLLYAEREGYEYKEAA